MKFTVNTASLSSVQMKFLSQLGEFRDNDETWVAGCEPHEFEEAMGWLKRAGIKDEDMFIEFGE